MAGELKSLLPRARRVPPLAALTFIVAVLLIFNLSNWRMMRLLEESKEEDLTRRVRSVTRLAAQNLSFPDPPEILSIIADAPPDIQADQLEEFPDSSEYESIALRVTQLKKASGLAQILLLTTAGDVVADSNYRFLTGEPLPFAIDAQYTQSALKGLPATTPLYAWEGEHFQRDYQPMVDPESGATVGIVMGSISADYLESLRQVRSQVLRLWILSSVFLVLLGIWLYRMFRYMSRLERRAMQKVRVEAMGALAGGMAHELRNPLAIIRALAEEIEADQPEKNRSTENSHDIVAETQRLSDLATHFLSLSRSPEAGESHIIDLNNEIERVVQLMRKSAPPEIVFSMNLPTEHLRILGDERAIRQLLLNLLVNAREALNEKAGKISIGLREHRRGAELTITDNGPGISRKELSRVFEPFYTTKNTGTGLGLAISRGIAENFGGELTMESKPGRGATATVILPLAEE